MKGYNGRILRIDLTAGKVSTEKPPEDYYKLYLGGRGFIIHTLLTELPKGIDPLGPDNKLIFALGLITGHPLLGSGRNSVGSKSPLTGAFGESEVGGFWGAELRRSGYDAIIVEGVSAKPVYLWINDCDVEICDAGKLWGLEVADTEKTIRDELGSQKVRTAVIGPAGENLVRYACIINDVSHVAGRTGMGAVMGSKNLKAIAVLGKRLPESADREKLVELSRWMGKNFKEKTGMWRYGTGAQIVHYEKTGNMPVKNFRGGNFPGAEKITAQVLAEKYVVKMNGCFGCPVRCKKVTEMEKPWKVNSVYGGPEYETLAALGANCGIDNLEALIKANELCGRYGLDTISTGVSISFAMECAEKGFLTSADTDGLQLNFGNAGSMVEMIKRIALRQGFGNFLAEGTKRASEKIGKRAEELAMHIKGEEIPMHEPRYKPGMGLSYSVHAAGADHCTGIHDDRVSKDLSSWEKDDVAQTIQREELSARKARLVYYEGLKRHLSNYLGICLFIPWSQDQITDAVQAITGWPISNHQLEQAVIRGISLARIFNLREGFTTKNDTMPHRFSKSPANGPLKGVVVDKEELEQAKIEYYRMLGWDTSGIPKKASLVELNIEWAFKYLENIR